MASRAVPSKYGELANLLHQHLDIATEQYEDCLERLRENLRKRVADSSRMNCDDHGQRIDRILATLARLEPVRAYEDVANTTRIKKKQSLKEKSAMMGVASHSLAGASVITLMIPPVGVWLGPILAGASALTGYLGSLLTSLSNDPPREDYGEVSEFEFSMVEINTQSADVGKEWREFIRLLVGLRKALDSLLASIERYLGVVKLKIGISRYPFEVMQIRAIIHNAREGAKVANLLIRHTDTINESFRIHLRQSRVGSGPTSSEFRGDKLGTSIGLLRGNLGSFTKIMPTAVDDKAISYFLQHFDHQSIGSRRMFFAGDLLDNRWKYTLKTLTSDLKIIAQHHNNLRKALIYFGSRYTSEVQKYD